jgi:tripartite ATP-independent transporter DctM subunit
MELFIFVLVFILLMVVGCPIAFAMVLSSLFYILLVGQIDFIIIPQRLSGGLDSFPLLAIPLFLLAGTLMNEFGITQRIFVLAQALVGHITGGLGHVNVLASMIFAGMSGSAIADAGGLGAIEMEAMNKAGYRREFSAAITASSSIIGPIIPPSISMVIYGVIASVSISKLFAGGLIPGIVMGVSLMIVIYYRAKSGKEKCPVTARSSIKEILKGIKVSFLPLLAPGIIVGGILLGIFTPTEAGGVAVVYTVILGIYYRELTVSGMITALQKTFLSTATVLFLIAGGSVFAWLIALAKLPEHFAELLFTISSNKYVILMMINIFLLIQGFFMSATAGVVIVAPMLLQVAQTIGVDPIHLGVFLIINLMIGIITPPVGMVLFTVSEVAEIKVEEVIRAIFPFYLPLVITLLLVTYFPQLVMFLPNMIK